MRILIWHVHGAWTTNFVQGDHEYLVPVTDARDADGLGNPGDAGWPANVVERNPDQLRDSEIDVVVLQRPHELDLVRRWLGRRPGRDVPAVYVEHNTPGGDPCRTRHHLADQREIPIVHVTHFNQLYWDNGRAPTTVIEQGVIDPRARFVGDVAAGAVVINEPIRRGRATGTDLLPAFAEAVPVDAYGMKVTGLADHLGVPRTRLREHESYAQPRMHQSLARRRVYLHPNRWTSIGLSLIEAMLLGLPVVVLAATESGQAVPPGAGVVSTRLDVLAAAAREFVEDRDAALEAGRRGREAALRRFGLARFLEDWDQVLKQVAG